MHSLKNLRRNRGSLLIVAMILCAIIGISLASYLSLAQTALRISNRSVYNNAAVNIAEQGIEEAMYSINKMVADSTYDWTGWTHPADHAWRKWTITELSQGSSAVLNVYVYNYRGILAPKIVSKATVTIGGNGGTVEKWIEVTLAKTSKFSNGLVAKNSITFQGNNATVDSWNSDPNGTGTPIQPYSNAVRNDNGSVGSISVSTSAVVVQNADVWGYVSTGGTDPTDFVGTNGSVTGDPPTPGPWTKANVDPGRVSTNFTATFDPVTAPTTAPLANLGTINTAGLVLPRASDVVFGPSSDGYYYYEATNIDLNNIAITINAKVVLRLTHADNGIAISGGNGAINITASGALNVYTAGAIAITGQGVASGTDGPDGGTGIDDVSELNQPSKFQIYGTKTTGTQSISLAGSSLFSGVIYAPQGNVSIVGNGAINGSVVANNIALSGNAQFHYDEALSNLGAGNPFRVGKWKELTTNSDRTVYATVMAF